MKVLLISENKNIAIDDVSQYKQLQESNVNIIPVRSSLLNASQRIANEVPDIVILDVADGAHGEFELAERFKSQYKNMTFMMMSSETSSDLLLQAMRAGFTEVIALPLSEQKLKEALDRYIAKQSVNTTNQSKVISVISCKGGGGSTFIATNLGYILAALFKKKVLLIDINQYFGDASLYLTDKKPAMTLAELCQQMNRFDYAFMESTLIPVLPNFKILAAAESPESASDVLPEHLERIIRMARNHYDYVILDVGRQIDGLTVKGLDLSDTIYTVVQLVLPYIRHAKHLMSMFRSLGYSPKKIQVLVNRYEKSSKIKLNDLSNAIGVNEFITIPNDHEIVSDSVNQGLGVYHLSNKNPVSQALINLAEEITKTQVKEKGFLAKIFKN